MRLTSYILKKLLSAVTTLLGLSIIIYYTTTFFPPQQRATLFMSDPELSMRGSGAPDPVPLLIEKYGLKGPWYTQYIRWVEVVLKGSLGWSYLYQMPVTKVILGSFQATLELVIYAAPIIIIGGFKLGVFSAKRASSRAPREDPVDFAVRSITIMGYSIPSFCIGLVLLLVFCVGLSWFSDSRLGNAAQIFIDSPDTPWTHYTGLYTIDAVLNGQLWIFFDAIRHLVLPVITMTIQNLAIFVSITRSSMIGELFKPYIFAARARGFNERAVTKQAKRPSMSPVLTVSGILFGGMLTGVVVTEYIFQIRGLGYVAVAAARRLDYPLLVGLSLVFCIIFMLVNLVVDIAYAYIDPRVKS